MRRGSRSNHLLDFWLGIPALNLLAAFIRTGRRRTWPSTVERIGVMSSPALGDTLLFSAVLNDIRRQFQRATIIHVCMRHNLAAAELIQGADSKIVVDLTRPRDTVAAIRRERFDVFLDFTSWQRLTAFYSLLSGARFTAGFRTEKQFRGAAYDFAAEHRRDRHELDNFRALVEAVGLSAGSPPMVNLPKAKERPIADASDIVVLHPWAGTKASIREWPESSWIGLAQALSADETVIVVTGSKGDRTRVDALIDRLLRSGLRAKSFIGEDGFVSLSHLLRMARVVVSVNTGVMHLAAILGCPTVSINGPTDNKRWGPVGDRVVGVASPGEGCGYLNLGFEFEGQPTDCMERTPVALVVEAARRVERKTAGKGCDSCPPEAISS